MQTLLIYKKELFDYFLTFFSVHSEQTHCSQQAKRMQTLSDLSTIWSSVYTCKLLADLSFLRQRSIVLKVQVCPNDFLQKQKSRLGGFMWRMSMACRRKIPLFSVWNAFLTHFWSLHVDAEQRPTLWSFCCVWVNNSSLSKLLWLIYLNCMVNKQTIMQCFQGQNSFPVTQLTSADCWVCWIPILDLAPPVRLSWEVCFHSRRYVSAAKTNSPVGWSLCVLYHFNPLCLCPPLAMWGPSRCNSTKGP